MCLSEMLSDVFDEAPVDSGIAWDVRRLNHLIQKLHRKADYAKHKGSRQEIQALTEKLQYVINTTR